MESPKKEIQGVVMGKCHRYQEYNLTRALSAKIARKGHSKQDNKILIYKDIHDPQACIYSRLQDRVTY